jgi:polysaccharide biosynthesis/export protein
VKACRYRTYFLLLPLVLQAACSSLSSYKSGSTASDTSLEQFVKADESDIFVWSSGELIGRCIVPAKAQDRQLRLSDSLTLDTHHIFIENSAELSTKGKNLLDELLLRIRAYDGVSQVGLADPVTAGGVDFYHLQLAKRRVVNIGDYLGSRLPSSISITTGHSGGKLQSAILKGPDIRASDSARSSRVDITIFAKGVRPDQKDPTLCQVQPDTGSDDRAGKSVIAAADEQKILSDIAVFNGPLPISVGDRFKITIPADSDFDGIYEVGVGGGLELPYLESLPVVGMTLPSVRRIISERLVERKLFRAGLVDIAIVVNKWSAADVFVQGAVFNPGRKTVNAGKAQTGAADTTETSGEYPFERSLSSALARAGGVRPDADLENIEVRRGSQVIKVDLSGIITGSSTLDFPLISDDLVIVPSKGYFQDELMRPSQITPPGVRVFLSNVTIANSIGSESTGIPYGSRMLQGALSANCYGGSNFTSTGRRAVLINQNPVTGEYAIIERSMKQLFSAPNRDDVNPYLMPNDGIACYDSSVINIRDLARTASDILSPFIALRLLRGD